MTLAEWVIIDTANDANAFGVSKTGSLLELFLLTNRVFFCEFIMETQISFHVSPNQKRSVHRQKQSNGNVRFVATLQELLENFIWAYMSDSS